ncbi:hypothetical protein BGZ63DRAFT_403153 [Mariannaea sp. PMI_226]|nr:hypothetical protein BGZ63DRAFT_403153 [Mariannaea sp. PMI_226]
MTQFWLVLLSFMTFVISAQPTCQEHKCVQNRPSSLSLTLKRCARDTLKPKCVDTPKPHRAIYYNDFECTVPEMEVIDADVTYGLVSPGFTGKKALGGWVTSPRGHDDHVLPIWAYFKDIPIKKNVPARLSLDGHFFGADAGEIKIVADGLFTSFFFAPLDSPKWTPFAVNFTSLNDTFSFSIGFGFSSDNSIIKYDNLLLEYVH